MIKVTSADEKHALTQRDNKKKQAKIKTLPPERKRTALLFNVSK